MKEQFIRVVMSNNEVWDVPAYLVAEHRTDQLVSPDEDDAFYWWEYELVFKEPDLLFEWAKNNMTWEDVMVHSDLISPDNFVNSDYNYQLGWKNSDMELIEKEYE